MSSEQLTGDTRDAADPRSGGELPETPIPGLVLIFSESTPRFTVIPLHGGQVVLGRGDRGHAQIPDGFMSRRHAVVWYDGQKFAVQDLGSRNGTAVDGEELEPHVWRDAERIVRTGDSLFLVDADVRPWIGADVLRSAEGRIIGPRMRRVLDDISRVAAFGSTLHVVGESGVGKESAARAFHERGPCPSGPFIAVNCAAIPEGIAERLLFGARRGAYSGAAGDAEGLIQASDGGTLFLDEIAELDLSVQGKLLRVLESREILPLGATRPVRVSLRICSATHKDLRAEVAAGRMRQDLYFRIGRPEVAIPPLRERLAEIPWLISAALEKVDAALSPHVSLVQACLTRPWPGNIRELLIETQDAAQRAVASDSPTVRLIHLGARAGIAFSPAPEPPSGPLPGADPRPSSPVQPASQHPFAFRPLERPPASRPSDTPPASRGLQGPQAAPPSTRSENGADLREPSARATLEEILRRAGGNVSEAARVLGLHRTQLRRLLAHHKLDPRTFPRLPKPAPPEEEPW